MTPHLATLQYNEMLRLLARRGIRKAPGQTPLEFATSLPDGNLAAPVHELTGMYQAARFGGQTADARQASHAAQPSFNRCFALALKGPRGTKLHAMLE